MSGCFQVVIVLLSCTLISSSLLERRWGVSLHRTDASDETLQHLSMGFRITRQDFRWDVVEKQHGVYNFSLYESWVDKLLSQNPPVLPYFILCYGNPLYSNGTSPATKEDIAAFVEFAIAGIRWFRGLGIVWELWNEPNGNFWTPSPNAAAYAALAIAVGHRLRDDHAISAEIFVGPALSGPDVTFLKAVKASGGLKYFDAISIHPYNFGAPELRLSLYADIRAAVGDGRPLISGEWGWSTCGTPDLQENCIKGASPDYNSDLDQANYLARQWLVNTLVDIPISIYYDYENDGHNSSLGEDNFGTRREKDGPPKMAYAAAATLQHLASQRPFVRSIAPGTRRFRWDTPHQETSRRFCIRHQYQPLRYLTVSMLPV
eukprot:m.495965 g.495965  ORF g.495965 m.495965 type:complete len:375 (-) comp21804_c0_seq8:1229-2353(-)